MVEHVPLDQTSPKMNKDENIRAMVHMTWELNAQKENMLLLHEIYLLANLSHPKISNFGLCLENTK
jgi:hypothetical protein